MDKNVKPVFVSLLIMASIILIIARFCGMAYSADILIISVPIDQPFVTYQGLGNPGSQVTMEVTASISLDIDSNHRYYKFMKGVNIPDGSSFSITASPVDTFSVSGGRYGIGMTIGSVSDHNGSASMSNVPGGTYDIVVTGISNSSGSVLITVHANRLQSVGGDGTFTASISTSGLPPAVYSVKQDGTEVARVYLGVQAPATPTPIVTTTPNGVTAQASVTSITPTSNASITPTPNVPVSPTPGIWISPTAQPGETEAFARGINSLLMNIALMIGAVITGLVIGYIVVFVILKKK